MAQKSRLGSGRAAGEGASRQSLSAQGREGAVVYSFLEEVTSAVEHAATVEECTARVIRVICQACGWSVGRIYLADEESGTLVFSGQTAADEDLKEQRWRTSSSEEHCFLDLARAAYAFRQPQWTAKPRSAGEGWAIACPVVGYRQRAGALVFVSRSPTLPDDCCMGELLYAANQLGLAIERRNSETEIIENRQFMQMVADNVPYFLFVFDLDARRIVFANKRTSELLGLSPHALIELGDRVMEHLIHPDELPRVLDDLNVLQKHGLERPVEADVRLRHANGQWRWFHIRRVPFSRDAEGKVHTFLATGLDVTASKRARQALAESDNRFRAIFNNAGWGVALSDEQGRITLSNTAFQRFTGYTGEELYKRPFIELTHPKDRASNLAYFQELWEGTRRNYQMEKRYIRKDGTILWGHLTVSLLCDENGRPANAIGVVKDINERKELEKAFVDFTVLEQRKILQYLHNSLGQQLTGMEIMARNLEQRLTEHETGEADVAGEIVEWLGQAHGQLRALVASIRPVEVDASGLSIALRDLAVNTQRLAGVRCLVDCDDELSLSSDDTAAHLFSITQQAVTNAVQHGGTSEIHIALHRNDGHLNLTVADSGVGPDKDSIDSAASETRLMRFRARIMGAALTISTGPEGGTIVKCTLKEDSA